MVVINRITDEINRQRKIVEDLETQFQSIRENLDISSQSMQRALDTFGGLLTENKEALERLEKELAEELGKGSSSSA